MARMRIHLQSATDIVEAFLNVEQPNTAASRRRRSDAVDIETHSVIGYRDSNRVILSPYVKTDFAGASMFYHIDEELADGVNRLIETVTDLSQRVVGDGKGVVRDGLELHLRQGQALVSVVVQVGRDVPSLAFLRQRRLAAVPALDGVVRIFHNKTDVGCRRTADVS
jgi:hypothetical protein